MTPPSFVSTGLIVCFLVLDIGAADLRAESPRPNIVLIMADDKDNVPENDGLKPLKKPVILTGFMPLRNCGQFR